VVVVEEGLFKAQAMNEADAGRDRRRKVSMPRRGICLMDHRAICLTNLLNAGFGAFDIHLLQIHMTTHTASGGREGVMMKIRYTQVMMKIRYTQVMMKIRYTQEMMKIRYTQEMMKIRYTQVMMKIRYYEA
jgi:hypothetical protein